MTGQTWGLQSLSRVLDMRGFEQPRQASEEQPAETEAADGEARPDRWGWVKDRLKGLGTLGIAEFHAADTFRRDTREGARRLESAAREGVQRTRYLAPEEAADEAERMQERLEQAPDREAVGLAAYDIISAEVTAEKEVENRKFIDELLDVELDQLQRKLGSARGASGRPVPAESFAALRLELQDELLARERGVFEAERRAIAQAIRKRVDPQYWLRYVYGSLESAIDLALVSVFAGGAVAAHVKGGTYAAELLRKAGPLVERGVSFVQNWKESHG